MSYIPTLQTQDVSHLTSMFILVQPRIDTTFLMHQIWETAARNRSRAIYKLNLKKIMLTLCFPAGVFLVAAPTSAKNQPRLFSSPLRNRNLQHALPASDTNRTLHLSGVAPSCSSCLEGRYVFLRLYHPNSQRSTCPRASDW